MSTRRFDIDWGTTGASLFYRVLDAANATLVARTALGSGHESPAGSGLYYVIISGWDNAWSGRIVWDDGTDFAEEAFGAGAASASAGQSIDAAADQYLDADGAATLLATLPTIQFASLRAAASDQVNAALLMASSRVDASRRWQGQKYSPVASGEAQVLEFPRAVGVRAPGIGLGANTLPSLNISPAAWGEQVWDWDADNNVAIVPRNVLLATLFEADSILSGTRDAMMRAQHDGLASQSIGSASESYRATTKADGRPALVLDADLLLQKYELRSGQML